MCTLSSVHVSVFHSKTIFELKTKNIYFETTSEEGVLVTILPTTKPCKYMYYV